MALRTLITLLLVLGAVSSARAQGVNVTIEPGPGANFSASLGLNIPQLEDQLQTELQDIFNTINPGAYLQAMSDAQAFSTKGLGVDYASNPTFLSVGASGNFTVAFGNDGLQETQKDRPVAGLSANISLMGGVNLGKFSPRLRDLIVYGNFFSYKADVDEMGIRLTNFGAHVQYKILRPKKRRVRQMILQWGGIDLTGGLEFSRMSIRLARPLPTDIPFGDQNAQNANVVFTGNGRFDLDSTTITLPAEVSTNMRIFYFLTVFGGAGIDLQVGTNKMDVQLSGTLQGTDPQGTTQEIGTATVDVSETAAPNAGKMRFFGGLQVNAWRAKAFVQGNVAPDRAFGLTIGGRVAW